MRFLSPKTLKFLRLTHRYVSFFCTGVLALYIISGFLLNHQREFKFLRQKKEYSKTVTRAFPDDLSGITENQVKSLLLDLELDPTLYKKHTVENGKLEIQGSSQLKVSVSGSTMQADVSYIYRPPFLTALNGLHRNPNKLWTWFSDISLVLFAILIITGLVIVPGKKGLGGIGGLLLLAGLAIPVIIYLLL